MADYSYTGGQLPLGQVATAVQRDDWQPVGILLTVQGKVPWPAEGATGISQPFQPLPLDFFVNILCLLLWVFFFFLKISVRKALIPATIAGTCKEKSPFSYLPEITAWRKMALCPEVGRKHRCISSLNLPSQSGLLLSGNLCLWR